MKEQGWKKIYCAKNKYKNAGETRFILDIAEFKWRSIIRNSMSHFIMIEESTDQEDVTISNMYVRK